MKRKILIAINSILAFVLSVFGFSACNSFKIGRGPECMYGGPDMYEKLDTLKVDEDQKMRVMYGGPYSRYNEQEKVIVEEKSE